MSVKKCKFLDIRFGLDHEVIRFVSVPFKKTEFRLFETFRLFNIHLVVQEDKQMYI